jgi:hypothetical protein
MTTETRPAEPVTTSAQPVPRWARRAAYAAVWSTVPSGLWRLALGVGIPLGFSGELQQMWDRSMPGWGTVYVIALSLIAEAFALLTLGLIRPWGEVWPRWVPLLGGQRIPRWFVLSTASIGAVLVTLLHGVGAVLWTGPENMGDPDAPQGAYALLMTAAYAPLLAWGPLFAMVTYAYYRRTANRPTWRSAQ